MIGYLFDTSSLSLLAPGRSTLASETRATIRRRSATLFVPTIALAEIHAGIAKQRRKGAVQRADELDRWLSTLRLHFADRIVSFDAAAAERAGAISDVALAIGRHPGFADVAIAGMASSCGLTVLTENRRHFEPLGVDAVELAEMN